MQWLYVTRRFHSFLILPAVLWIFPLFRIVQPNSPPVAANDSYTVHSSLLMPVTANDYDPDNDNMTIQSFSSPQHGTLTWYTQSALAYSTTANGYVGPDSFTYIVCDGVSGCSSPATVNITIVNQAPVANPDYYTVHNPIFVAPAANDTDPDHDSISFQSIATQPQHGTLTYYSPGNYSYHQ